MFRFSGLHPLEREVLSLLRKENGRSTLSELFSKYSVPEYAVYRACVWLSDKGFVKLSKRTETSYEYTELGKKYLEKGLPEEQLLKLLSSGPKSFRELLNHLDKDELNAALGYLKQLNLVSVERGTVKLEKQGNVPWDLRKPGEYVDFFVGRGLMEKKENHEYVIELTPDGWEVDISEEFVEKLTPEMIKKGLWKNKKFRSYDLSRPVRRIYPGKLHFYLEFIEEIKDWLVSRGFEEIRGPIIISELYNFDLLFQPQHHPARDWTDTYQLEYPEKQVGLSKLEEEVVPKVKALHEKGWEYSWSLDKAMRLMPRAHTTAISALKMLKGVRIPGKYFAIAWCTRPDEVDGTHDREFDQLEGFVVGEDITFRELLGMLKDLTLDALGLEDAKVKFFADYYPFTEPSVQISIKHPKFGWLELAGAGMFREEVTKPLGIDVPVIAWGFGFSRLAMLKLGISDIREFYSHDIDYLRRFPYAKG